MTEPIVVHGKNLSMTWGAALLRTLEHSEPSTLVFTLDTDPKDIVESPVIRTMLDTLLTKLEMQSCETVANTIFPYSLWKPSEAGETLYARYVRILPRLHHNRKNFKGLYFERLIDFENGGEFGSGVNQLGLVIDHWRLGVRRRSALTASIFSPHTDHSKSPYLGFPCLHQVSFVPDTKGGVRIVAYYARQYLVEKAYGNYLGLLRLGQFMAHELGLNLTGLTCTAGVSSLGDGGVTKRGLGNLAKTVEAALQE